MCNEKNEIKATQTTLIDSNIIFFFLRGIAVVAKVASSGSKERILSVASRILMDGWMLGEFDLPNYTP